VDFPMEIDHKQTYKSYVRNVFVYAYYIHTYIRTLRLMVVVTYSEFLLV